MRILVTGGLGTIGSPLVSELQDRGHHVWATDARHSHHENYRRADLREFRQLSNVFHDAEPDLVYHLGAEFGRHNGEDYYEDVWTSNVVGTRHVIELCDMYGIKLVYASSSEVYGDCYDGKLTEDVTKDKTPLQMNDYAITKWVTELQMERLYPEAMVCRFFNSYGPGEYYTPYRSVVALFCYRMLTKQKIDLYDGYSRAFMFMDDFIPTLANAADTYLAGHTVNIGGAEVRTVNDLAHIALEATGASPGLLNIMPYEEHNTVSKVPDNSKAAALLGHDPKVGLEEGVPLTVKWMRKEYGL